MLSLTCQLLKSHLNKAKVNLGQGQVLPNYTKQISKGNFYGSATNHLELSIWVGLWVCGFQNKFQHRYFVSTTKHIIA